MAKMYLMCGLSGAGKTTFAKEFAAKNGFLYLGIDDYYEKVNGDECDRSNTFEVWIEFYKAIHEAEVNNINCVVDTNALTVCHRQQFLEWFPTFKHYLILVQASQTLREQNNLSRRRHVPDDVMKNQIKCFENPVYDKQGNWVSIVSVYNDNNNFREPKVLIIGEV